MFSRFCLLRQRKKPPAARAATITIARMLIPALKPAFCVTASGGTDALLLACAVALGLGKSVFPLGDGVAELAATSIVV